VQVRNLVPTAPVRNLVQMLVLHIQVVPDQVVVVHLDSIVERLDKLVLLKRFGLDRVVELQRHRDMPVEVAAVGDYRQDTGSSCF